MRKSIWKSDWFVGTSVVVLILILHISTSLFTSLDSSIYDSGLRNASRNPSDKVAVIAVDNQSIENLGRWPWPRDIQARMIDRLNESGAKIVASTVLLTEPQRDPAIEFIQALKTIAAPPAPAPEASAAMASAAVAVVEDARWQQVRETLAAAEARLNTDGKLAASMLSAGNVVVPFSFEAFGAPQGNPDQPLPDYIARAAISVQAGDGAPPPALQPQLVLPEFGRAAHGVGVLMQINDEDGVYRREPVAVDYHGQVFPSLAVMTVARALNLNAEDIRLQVGHQLRIGNLSIAVDQDAMMRPFYYADRGGASPFAIDSFFDVYSGKIGLDKYKGKIVLIGATAPGVGQVLATPVNPRMPAVESVAHNISSLLTQQYVVEPAWGGAVSALAVLLVAAYLIVLLPRLKAGVAAAISGVLFVVLVGSSFFLLQSQLVWLPEMVPAGLLLLGHLALTTFRFLTTERGKERSEAESAESNRMLGLAFQGQGQLDMAFDKLRKVPLDDSMMDILYNLALDFERKRQFNKAHAVFEYMSTHNAKYKDVEQRMKRSRAMEETVILGGATRSNSSTLVMDAEVEKPMLGRYQVEKELGKGAMGVVYLGRDPKISRVVAIKTMALSQEFDADELEDVRARFFREAETAGRLNHPNIVTIYDAGEEHDLAYIAMEFLKGRDLVPYAKAGQLLPLSDVLNIVRQVADALGYAHQHNVVHRDIKPANIMYEPETRTVKVTDFGIARITDSSKTKTGMVLGTPSYMSPEQLSGKKIDGRSDLFSLGVTLYQLCCGQLPFRGESMAELMYCIANSPHRNIRDVNPDLPIVLSALINQALAKNPDQRYQTGFEFAEAIRQCEASINADKTGSAA